MGGFLAAQGVFWMLVSPGIIVGDVISNPSQMLFQMVPSNLIGWLNLPLHLASRLPSLVVSNRERFSFPLLLGPLTGEILAGQIIWILLNDT